MRARKGKRRRRRSVREKSMVEGGRRMRKRKNNRDNKTALAAVSCGGNVDDSTWTMSSLLAKMLAGLSAAITALDGH